MAYPNDPPAPADMLPLSGDLSTGLVGFWPLTDGSGTTAVDISSGGNDGTASGGVTWDATTIGTAAGFDGVNGYIDLGDNYDFGDGTTDSAFSVSGWMYLDALPAAGVSASLFSKTSQNVGDTNGSAYNVQVSSSGVFALRLYDDSGSNQINAVSAASAISTGTWYHLAVTYDSSGSNTGIEVYVDGVNAVDSRGTGSGTYVAMEDETTTAKIGCAFLNNATYEGFVDGNIQNVRVYNRALSSTEVATLYSDPWVSTSYTDSANTYFFPAQFTRL